VRNRYCASRLLSASIAQQSIIERAYGVPDTCPVTKPYDRPFVSPFWKPEKQPQDGFWFGTDRLWTRLPTNGTWRGLPHYTPDDPRFRQKLFFWRAGYDAHKAILRLYGPTEAAIDRSWKPGDIEKAK
jgi:hypothetical protein